MIRCRLGLDQPTELETAASTLAALTAFPGHSSAPAATISAFRTRPRNGLQGALPPPSSPQPRWLLAWSSGSGITASRGDRGPPAVTCTINRACSSFADSRAQGLGDRVRRVRREPDRAQAPKPRSRTAVLRHPPGQGRPGNQGEDQRCEPAPIHPSTLQWRPDSGVDARDDIIILAESQHEVRRRDVEAVRHRMDPCQVRTCTAGRMPAPTLTSHASNGAIGGGGVSSKTPTHSALSLASKN
jgi:hypothetical protein